METSRLQPAHEDSHVALSEPVAFTLNQGRSGAGNLAFRDGVRIEGFFTGQLSSEAQIVVARTGAANGNLTASEIVIDGSVRGNVVARDRLVIGPRGFFEGEARTRSLIVADGAVFNGRLRMGTA